MRKGSVLEDSRSSIKCIARSGVDRRRLYNIAGVVMGISASLWGDNLLRFGPLSVGLTFQVPIP